MEKEKSTMNPSGDISPVKGLLDFPEGEIGGNYPD